MSFRGCPQMGGSQLALLGQGLPPSLIRLDLDFSQCSHVGSAGIAALSRGFPLTLEKLVLRFRQNWQLDDTGLAALGMRLPAELKHLELHFQQCKGFEDTGVAALGRGLQALKTAVFSFTECTRLKGTGIALLVDSPPSNLGCLHLGLKGCTSIDSRGFAAIGLAIPKHLRDLSIGCTFTKIDDEGIAGLAAGIQTNTFLTKLSCGFGASLQVSSAGIAAISQNLPKGLEQLRITFDQDQRVGNDGMAALAQSISSLSSLRRLDVQPNGSSVGDAGACAFVHSLPPSLEELPLRAGKWYFWGGTQLSREALKHFKEDLDFLRRWKPAVKPAIPAQPTSLSSAAWSEIYEALPPPLGTGASLAAVVEATTTWEVLDAELIKEEPYTSVRYVTEQEAIIDVPTPCDNKETEIPDERPLRFNIAGLAPMRRILLTFSGIHNSHYIGINQVRLFAGAREVNYTVLTKGANPVKKEVGGWWTRLHACEHPLLLDLGESLELSSVALLCTNGGATPKKLHITEG